MYKHILLGVDTQIKMRKLLKRCLVQLGEGTIVTVLNAINEQDAQASIKAGVHLDKLTEERSKRLEKQEKHQKNTELITIKLLLEEILKKNY